jgi:hypothetical protein
MGTGAVSALTHYRNQNPQTSMIDEFLEQSLVAVKVGSLL